MITFEPDDVNQDASIMLADGRRVAIADLDEGQLVAASRQLWQLRSAYAEAFVAAHPGRAGEVIDERDLDRLSPLHRAIAKRQADVQAGKGRSAASVPEQDLFQAATWTSRDGTSRALTLLSPAHRRSLVAWLERNAADLADRLDPMRTRIEHADPRRWVRATPVHLRLSELIAEQSGLDEAKDRARQISRRLHFEATGTWPEEGPVRPSAKPPVA